MQQIPPNQNCMNLKASWREWVSVNYCKFYYTPQPHIIDFFSRSFGVANSYTGEILGFFGLSVPGQTILYTFCTFHSLSRDSCRKVYWKFDFRKYEILWEI